MGSETPVLVLCNAASPPDESSGDQGAIVLDYRDRNGGLINVKLGLPNFVRDVYHLPDRTLDLLELAAYVYCADRMSSRGPKVAVEYQAWARSFHFVVKVRDHTFWSQSDVSACLSRALQFMAGDREYRFSFQPGHSTPRTGLFDDEQFRMESSQDLDVALFSGGIDSLAGVLNHLETTNERSRPVKWCKRERVWRKRDHRVILSGQTTSSRRGGQRWSRKGWTCWSYCTRGEWTVTWTSYGRL